MTHRPRQASRTTRRLLGAAALVALLAAAAWDTKFLSPERAAEVTPATFSAEDYAAEAFPQVREGIKEMAVDLSVLAPAVSEDPAAAAAQYGQDLGSGSFVFPVRATGAATDVDGDFLVLDVPGVPDGVTVRVALGVALSGTPVRDATGNIRFGDFTGQTDFQSVANQFKLLMQRDVLAGVDPPSLLDQHVTVHGAWSTGGPPDSFIIQPVEIEAVP